MLSFIWWIIIGLVAGLIARLLVPGRQPMGWLLTIGLGLLGSVVGGFISSAMFGTDPATQDCKRLASLCRPSVRSSFWPSTSWLPTPIHAHDLACKLRWKPRTI